MVHIWWIGQFSRGLNCDGSSLFRYGTLHTYNVTLIAIAWRRSPVANNPRVLSESVSLTQLYMGSCGSLFKTTNLATLWSISYEYIHYTGINMSLNYLFICHITPRSPKHQPLQSRSGIFTNARWIRNTSGGGLCGIRIVKYRQIICWRWCVYRQTQKTLVSPIVYMRRNSFKISFCKGLVKLGERSTWVHIVMVSEYIQCYSVLRFVRPISSAEEECWVPYVCAYWFEIDCLWECVHVWCSCGARVVGLHGLMICPICV